MKYHVFVIYQKFNCYVVKVMREIYNSYVIANDATEKRYF